MAFPPIGAPQPDARGCATASATVPPALRVALIGAGAMGADIAQALDRQHIAGAQLVAVLTRSRQARADGAASVTSLAELLLLAPDVIVECAGAQAFADHVPVALAGGVDVIAVSMAAMARLDVAAAIARATGPGSGTLHFASGALGGLDALSAAREGGLTRVEVIQRKPPAALMDAAQAAALTGAQVVKRASAREVALALPQNSNVAAAVAIAGLGFDATQVTVIADPAVTRNTVELQVEGMFGCFHLVIENHPSPANPKTSMTPAMSVLAALRRRISRIRIPA